MSRIDTSWLWGLWDERSEEEYFKSLDIEAERLLRENIPELYLKRENEDDARSLP